jgi:hypothetical protein
VEKAVEWVLAFQEQARASESTLAQTLRESLMEKFQSEEALKDQMNSKIPFSKGYNNFLAVPKTSKKGVAHITFILSPRPAIQGTGSTWGTA